MKKMNKKGAAGMVFIIILAVVVVGILAYMAFGPQQVVDTEVTEDLVAATKEGDVASIGVYVRDLAATNVNNKVPVAIYCVDEDGAFIIDGTTSSATAETTGKTTIGATITCYAYNATVQTLTPAVINVDKEAEHVVIDAYTLSTNAQITLYDDTLADAIAKHLRLKAAWMERELAKISPNTIIFVDEPYLASLGSAFVALSNDTVIKLTNEVLGGISGIKGIHCCGNTDWSVLMASDIDILNFDAFSYGESLALYPNELQTFVARGGIVAWGIVPNHEEKMAGQTVTGVVERLDELIRLLVAKGINHDILLEQSMITPSCSLASMSPHASDQSLKFTAEVSREFRRLHGLEGN